MKKSRRKEQLHGTQTSLETHQDLISNLPDEIILQIVEHLSNSSFPADYDCDKKMNQTIMFVVNQEIDTEIYQHNPESPILTDLQSFSCVNRKIYSICRPIIWQSLHFSPRVSRPMSFWNKEILPKHGAYVRELDVTLSDEWVEIPNPFSIQRARISRKKDKSRYKFTPRLSDLENVLFLENHRRFSPDFWKIAPNFELLDFHVQFNLLEFEQDIVILDSTGLCPEDLVTLLSHCDRLTTLHLNCPLIWSDDPNKIRSFSSNLTSLFLEVGHLQHLKITGHSREEISAECIINPISYLPLLESLELANVSATSSTQASTQANSLGTQLSTLKNLKKLVLKQVDVIDSSWANLKGPPKLENLMIYDFNHCLALPDTPRFISSWAPHLTHLELKFSEHWSPLSPDDFVHFDPKRNQFSLPNLTHLTFWPRVETQYIHCFSDCQNLSRLLFYLTTRVNFADRADKMSKTTFTKMSNELSSLSKFISTNSFPKLKVLTLLSEYGDEPSLEGILGSKFFPLKTICESKGIKLIVFPRDF